jgi:diketogulonate reductase-like aldo/keto reductase
MERRRFGIAEVSAVGQGTWYIEQGDRRAAVAALQRGLDLGLTHIDTAEMYGSGAAETLVGEAIRGRRDEVFLVSKVLPSNASRQGTIQACDRSLRRLGTDRLDGYLLHWPGSHPLAETVAAFEQLKQAGKIRSWGVSNFDVADLEAIARHGMPTCNQVLYHLGERAIEHAVIPWCAERNIAVVAYSPFGHQGGFPRGQSQGRRVLEEVAAANGATPRQVTLQFLLRQPSVLVIPKASQITHVEDNAGAAGLELDEADLARIDRAFPRGPRPQHLPML